MTPAEFHARGGGDTPRSAVGEVARLIGAPWRGTPVARRVVRPLRRTPACGTVAEAAPPLLLHPRGLLQARLE